ncbi:MAG TPA: ACP S-malonyltransferase [Mycobacteriales bacterium]|nr:ACP S-malonyltransferase [Mycobacteriales bacterium]
MTTVVTFPGQGSQQPGAGAAWQQTPQWALVEQGSDTLGRDISKLLLDTPADELKRPWEAQVATYVVSMLVWDAWRQAGKPAPAALAGHSLGEWTALAAGGAVDFATGLRLVAARGAAMADAALARPGTMAALMGAQDDAVERACADAEAVWPANFNAAGQVVISGDPAGFEQVGAAAGARRVVPIPVGGAYHTPFMAPAREALTAALAQYVPGAASVPIWSNVDALPHTDGFAERLAAQLTSPVRWRQTVTGLVAAGADHFVELGPGTVLTNLAKRNAPDATLTSVATPQELS